MAGKRIDEKSFHNIPTDFSSFLVPMTKNAILVFYTYCVRDNWAFGRVNPLGCRAP